MEGRAGQRKVIVQDGDMRRRGAGYAVNENIVEYGVVCDDDCDDDLCFVAMYGVEYWGENVSMISSLSPPHRRAREKETRNKNGEVVRPYN